MDAKTVIFWIIALALIWFLLRSIFTRGDSQYGGMDPGVFDQMASNTGIEDTYLMTPDTFTSGYDYDALYPYGYNYAYIY